MEIKELRIGNYISPLGIGVTKVEGFCIWDNLIQSSNFAERSIEDFEPIPLTEEWLIKFGLKQSNLDIKRFYLLGTDLYFFNNKKIIFNAESSSLYVELKYVHQLQNLYFSITQTELEIKNHL
jgi:hypothetical protein